MKKFSIKIKDMEPLSAALGAMYFAVGVTFIVSGAVGLVRGLGVRGRAPR